MRALPASCRAGHRCVWSDCCTVNRIAWLIAPAATSSSRTSPGKIGSPAASEDVHVFGRSAFELRSKIAPDHPVCAPL